jgi:predicted RNA methylase
MTTTRSEDNAILLGVAGLLAVLAAAGIASSIVLFAKKKSLWGGLVLALSVGCGLLALCLAALVVLSMFAWH